MRLLPVETEGYLWETPTAFFTNGKSQVQRDGMSVENIPYSVKRGMSQKSYPVVIASFNFRRTNKRNRRRPLVPLRGNVTNISQKEASQKFCPIVIARRNDEAIRLFSGVSGLLHFVRNDEIGLLRQPQCETLSGFSAKPHRVSMRNLTGFQCETLSGFSAKPYRVSVRNLTGGCFKCPWGGGTARENYKFDHKE
jgi:hypothetical protein